MRISHIPVNLCLGHQCGHRVYDHDIHRPGTDHCLRNLQRLLPVIRLRDVKIVYIYANVLGIDRIQRMLRINKPGNAASLLHLCHHM